MTQAFGCEPKSSAACRAITPESIVNRLEDRGTGLHRSIERRIRIRHPQAQRRRRSTKACWCP
jgi:hypothetical protein